MSNLVISQHLNQSRSVPEWFAIALRDVDPSLIVFWNPIRSRWIIDRCTAGGEHSTANHQHTPECPRTNVKVIQDEAGEYLALSQEVIDWLRAHDTWNQHANVHDYLTYLNNKDSVYQGKLRADRRANTRHATRDNKRQLGQMWHLIQQHDLKVNQ